MKYDKLLKKQIDKKDREYGIFNGSNTIFLIKVGQDATVYGFENKYITIASNINKKYGVTTITSSNPFDGTDHIKDDMEFVREYAKSQNFENYNIYYMGYSNGAFLGATYGYKYPEIKKMLLINIPLGRELISPIEGISNFMGENLTIIYGDKDNSFTFVPYIFPSLSEIVDLQIIEGADHHFTNKLDLFISLPDTYLFDSYKKNLPTR